MPNSISIESKIFKTKSTQEYLGVNVPWDVVGYLEDLVAAETVGGVFDFSSWATIQITGKDTKDFLQRMSTVNFKVFTPQTVTHGAFLTGKGTVVTLGVFLEEKEKIHYLLTPNQEAIALEHLEKFHFQEELQIESKSSEWGTLAWWNPRGDLLEDFHLERDMATNSIDWRRWKSLDMLLWRDGRCPDLFWIHTQRKYVQPLLFEFHRLGVSLLGQHLFEYFRIQHAIPQVGIEVSDKEIVLETGFDEAVARNKGCYPGQEVVERIFTYGSVNRRLNTVTVETSDGKTPMLPLELGAGDKHQGVLVSVAMDPRKPKTGIGLAYLNKSEWDQAHTYKKSDITVHYSPVKK